ncbi:lysophospholipid acyltransferase 2-like [Protopterus annectens]|uniref:lysophospholipid acyltransferase 2-like n=1 Tax=Protopterus annectens TaxID=7888 RepID=UPI001CFA23B8|nr:lysophospholipid acyltransferase 2-like [Protopterus annectens]
MGSALLLPLSERFNFPVAQMNFIACLMCGLIAACSFRIYLPPSKENCAIRHTAATLLGIYFAHFCYGWYTVHFVAEVIMSYFILVTTDVKHVHKYTFLAAMSYLTAVQISRVYVFDNAEHSADFTGPMMIITQKITKLAFEVHDGLARKEESLTPSQKLLAVRKCPSLLEYCSYNLNFMGILAGPLCSYSQYIEFIEGTYGHLETCQVNEKEKDRLRHSAPSPVEAVLSKLLMCCLLLMAHLVLSTSFPVSRNLEDSFVNSAPFYTRLAYLYFSLMGFRPKYYFAWTMADAVNNAAGFGFSGYSKSGKPQWNALNNINILQIETATSFKMFIDNWNIQTAQWLKEICYDRCPSCPTLFTFLLSAAWHGVYTGYFFTFLTGALMTFAARAVRSNFRHHFLASSSSKRLYDIITWIATQLAMSYTVAPFVLLHTEPSLQFYRTWFFGFHIAAFLLILVLPRWKKQTSNSPQVQSGDLR